MRKWYRLFILALIALAFGCSPDSPELEAPESPPGLENGSFTAPLNGFNIHYEVHGQGPVVMTVPNSWGLSLEGLRAVYRPLEEHLTMVYFDPRGMGESDRTREESDMGMAAVRADFDALRRHLGLETVNAIGWSNGATNLIYLAAELRETLSTAIFLHGAASFTEKDNEVWATRFPDMLEQFEAFQQEVADESIPVEGKTARQRQFWLDVVFPKLFADPEAGITTLQKIYAETEFSWPHTDYSNRETALFDAREELSAITARCLVIAGAHDMLTPEKVRELHDGLRDSEFVLFANSGHFSPVEEHEAFKAQVYDFLGIQ
jgi:pimeloyl-ACP methyl ester carboxylesterase